VRALSAIGFVISIVGLLLVCYNQFAIIPTLNDHLYSTGIKSYELVIKMTEDLEYQRHLNSILSIIIGAFSVIFCSFVYLQKRTRMTLIGIFVGFIVTLMGIVHTL
jgi:hypothetical protein